MSAHRPLEAGWGFWDRIRMIKGEWQREWEVSSEEVRMGKARVGDKLPH